MKLVKKLVNLFVASVFIICQGAQAAEEVTYYHVDILNSIVAATDINGDRKWEEEYYPHGNMTNDKGIDNNSIKDNAQWYTGKTKDDDTGLMYMGDRWYDPTIGRFYGVDPQQVNPNDVHTFNRYAYANNNPYKYIDPTGEFVVLIPAVIWAVSTALTAYDSYQVYKNEGALAAGKTLATGAALNAATGGIGKIAVNAIRYLKPVSSSIKAEAKVVTKGTKFAIDDGVRRAKSADLLGNKTIPARIKQPGKPDVFQDVPVSSLHSPKTEISADSRFFDRNFNPAKNGSTPPPIEIRQISGESPGLMPIRNVDLVP